MRFIFLVANVFFSGALCVQAGDLGTVPDALKQDIGKAGQTINGQKPADVPDFHLPFDSSVPPELRAQMLDDMAFMASIQGQHDENYRPRASTMHKEIFGPVSGSFYLDFFLARTRKISFDPSDKDSFLSAHMYYGPRQLMLYKHYTHHTISQLDRLDCLIHEARHAERSDDPRFDGWQHSFCDIPFLDANKREVRACDDTLKGGYGVTAVMFNNIARFCTNCTEKVRRDAQLIADDDIKRVNNPDNRKFILQDIQSEDR